MKIGNLRALGSLNNVWQKIYSIPFTLNPIENFSEYTVVNTQNKLTVETNKITLSGYVSNVDDYVYKDFGTDYFDRIYVDFEMRIDTACSTAGFSGIAFSNIIDDVSGSSVAIQFGLNKEAGGIRAVALRGNFATYDATAYAFSADTTYYARVIRAAGADTAICNFYTNVERTNKVATTLTLSGLSTTKYRYFYGINHCHQAGTYPIYGFIQNVQFAITPLPATSIIISGLNGNLLANSDFETWSAGASSDPDGWTTSGAGAIIAKESTIVNIGTYSAKLTRSGTNVQLNNIFHAEKGISYWRGRTVTFGAWVYATVATRVRLYIEDGVGTSESTWHTGGSTWEWITVTRTVDSSATQVYCFLGVISGDTSGYIDGAICIEGTTIPQTTSENIFNYCLNGDTDVEYMLRVKIVNGYNGGPNYKLLINNISTDTYGQQILYGANTTIGAGRSTTGNNCIVITAAAALGDISFSELNLYAKAGYIRTVIQKAQYRTSGTTVSVLKIEGQAWNNTADNITSLVILADQTNGIGIGSQIDLYRRIT
jgi:hypothetical protein